VIRPFVPLALIATLTGCTPATGPATSPERAGTIVRITGDIWAIAPSDAPSERYCLDGVLAVQPLRIDGLKVRFAGTAAGIPSNARVACTPFAFTSVNAIE
jgi:hypothetical protein